MKALLAPIVLVGLVLAAGSTQAQNDLLPAQGDTVVDCYVHAEPAQVQKPDEAIQHLLSETTDCALACINHAHTDEVQTPQEQLQHLLFELHSCIADWTGLPLRAAGLPEGPEICNGQPCVEPVGEREDGKVTVGVRHHVGLGGALLVTLTDHSVRVTHREGITVCWFQVDVEARPIVDNGCAF